MKLVSKVRAAAAGGFDNIQMRRHPRAPLTQPGCGAAVSAAPIVRWHKRRIRPDAGRMGARIDLPDLFTFLTGLILGLLVGTVVGVITMAALAASSSRDRTN
jgi:hypothetical protein